MRPFFVQKWHKIANFQNFQKSLLNFGPLYGVVMWCKFQLIWTKIEGADTFGVKYLKISICLLFCKRFYQNRELQNAMTFKRKLILTFRKKHLFPLIEIFRINPSWIFWPGPPYRLNLILMSFSQTKHYQSQLPSMMCQWRVIGNLSTYYIEFSAI